MNHYRLFKKLAKRLRKEFPTQDGCEWYIRMYEQNGGGEQYAIRLEFDYSHKTLWYHKGQNIKAFLQKVENEIKFYKDYDKED